MRSLIWLLTLPFKTDLLDYRLFISLFKTSLCIPKPFAPPPNLSPNALLIRSACPPDPLLEASSCLHTHRRRGQFMLAHRSVIRELRSIGYAFRLERWRVGSVNRFKAGVPLHKAAHLQMASAKTGRSYMYKLT